jgi:hypothetical protein
MTNWWASFSSRLILESYTIQMVQSRNAVVTHSELFRNWGQSFSDGELKEDGVADLLLLIEMYHHAAPILATTVMASG